MKVTAQDVAQLLASSLPRKVPAHVERAAQGGRSSGLLLFLGLTFLCFGLVFTAVFFPWRFLDDWKLSSDAAQTVTGHVTSVQDANMRINKVRVWDHEFTYTVGDGQRRTGHCFTTGQQWPEAREVRVRYLPTQPELACVEGARLTKAGGTGASAALFPLLGAGIGVAGVISRRNTRWLLQFGQVREVDVISVVRTGAQVNRRYVYKISITSPASLPGPPILVRRSDPAEVDLAQKRLSDKQSVYILHDPNHPRRILFPEALISR